MTGEASLRTVNGEPTLRFERRLAHSPEKVWRAVTDPAEMAAWFPAQVETELRPGAPIRFTFPGDAAMDGTWEGEVLEVDPPKVFMFRWNSDVLRIELIPDGDGCLLIFSQTLGGGQVGRLGAGRTAAGWDACLDGLADVLDGRTVSVRADWLTPMERYIDKFGLGEGSACETGSGYELHFARDLVWKPADDVWRVLVGTAPGVGGRPPERLTNAHVPAGKVTEVGPPLLLEYEWLHEDAPVGTVRWEIHSDPDLGVRIELTHTLPPHLSALRAPALAAWHVQMEQVFAAVMGSADRPWPSDRVDQLTKHYADQP